MYTFIVYNVRLFVCDFSLHHFKLYRYFEVDTYVQDMALEFNQVELGSFFSCPPPKFSE